MPISSPSYFPPNRTNGTVVGINAGNSTTGSRNFLAGKNTGAFLAVSDIIAIGDSVISSGTSSVPINDANAQYSIVIGSKSAQNFASGTGFGSTPNGPLVLIGGNSFPQAINFLSDTIAIGCNMAPLMAGLNPPNETGDNILIGHGILKNVVNTGGFMEFSYNVVIGNEALQGSLSGNTWLNNTIVGIQAGNILSNSNSGGTTDNTLIGYKAGASFTGARAQQNICLGSQAGANSFGSFQDNILIGYQAGQNATATDHQVFIDSGGTRGILFGDMSVGCVLIGNSATGSNRDFGDSAARNVLKILNGTKSVASPVGGGYFYVSAGALHWVGTGGTDTTLAVA